MHPHRHGDMRACLRAGLKVHRWLQGYMKTNHTPIASVVRLSAVLYIEYRHIVCFAATSYVCHNVLTSQDFIFRTCVATQRMLIEVESRNDLRLMLLVASSP